MRIHELINNTKDFSSPIIIDCFEAGERKLISKNLNRKVLLILYSDREIISIGAEDDYIRLTISID